MKIEIDSYWTDKHIDKDKDDDFMIVRILNKRKRGSNGERRVVYEVVYTTKHEARIRGTAEMVISHFRQAGRPATPAEIVLYVDKEL